MRKNTFRIALIVSLALHLVLAAVVWIQPEFLMLQRRTPTPSIIDLIDAADLMKKIEEQKTQNLANAGQIVTQSDQRLNDEVPKDSKYLSKHNQVVQQETRAALSGQFRNTTGAGGEASPTVKPGEAEKSSEQQTLSKSETKTKDDIAPETGNEKVDTPSKTAANDIETSSDGIPTNLSLKDLKPSFRPRPQPMGTDASGGGEGPSATDDHLKDVKTGLQTMLSTREFVYYSYYNRIKERLRQYWEPKIKEKMERIMRQGRTIASDTERVTKIIILLDSKGTLVRVQVLGPSGVTDLDDAAVEAFRAAAPFPNPPRGIVEKDGLIRIRWDFVLEAAARFPFDARGYAHNR